MAYFAEKTEPSEVFLEKVEDTEHRETASDKVLDSPTISDEEDLNFKWTFDVITTIIACTATYFAAIFATVAPSGAIAFIILSFPEEAENDIWIAAATTVTGCVLQAFCGDLSDQLGRKTPILAGMILGVTGTILAGRAASLTMVIGGQVLSGIGLTLGYLCVPLLQEIVPKDKRPTVMAISGAFAGIAYSTGNVISGAFINADVGGPNEGWRCAFYVSAALYALGFILIAIFYHPSPRPNPENLSIAKRLAKIDWIGVFLIAAGLSIFLVGLQSGGNPTPWVSARVIACMVIGFILFVTFCTWEWRGTSNGIMAHSLFGHCNFAVILALCFVGGMTLFGGQAFLPQEVIYLFTSDALLTGVWGLPFNMGTVVGGIIGGIWFAITKEAKPIIIFTFAFLILGNCLMLIVKPHVQFAAWFFPSGIMGVAVGIQTTVLLVAVTLCTPDHLIAAATSLSQSVRGLGGSIGVVIFSQIFTSKVKVLVPGEIAKRTIEAGLPISSVESLVGAIMLNNPVLTEHVPGITPQILSAAREALRDGYSNSFKYVWYSLIPFAVASIGLSFLLRSTKAQMTNTVAASIEHRRSRM
ncbi:major facilitator superfamily domain-containing protein [Cadophora sp. MPI-SDFR-AT-0126]|nr:major facilitator superfamily domain-containing protein [Leotiomycetes sp. MPI-SDFR-AT-0126]